MSILDLRDKKQQKKEHKILKLAEWYHIDMEYQLKITHVEYINRDTRKPKLPKYDLRNHPNFRPKRKFWIAYAGDDIRAIHEEFFLQKIMDENGDVDLFNKTWVTSKVACQQNIKHPLTTDQRQNIVKLAKAAGYHPNDRVAYIRRDFDAEKNIFVWRGKTEAGIEVILDQKWVELNLINAQRQWYCNTIGMQLYDENIDDPEKQEWVQLPVGEYVDTTTKATKQDMYEFKYQQSTHGDVCTLINIINILDYMEHNKTVTTLVPYMNEKIWYEHQQQHAPSKKHGYEISQVMQLLRRICKYSHTKKRTDNLMKMNKKLPFILKTSPTHAIGVFDHLIFDANNTTVKKLTLNNLKEYELEKFSKTIAQGGKLLCWVFDKGDISQQS